MSYPRKDADRRPVALSSVGRHMIHSPVCVRPPRARSSEISGLAVRCAAAAGVMRTENPIEADAADRAVDADATSLRRRAMATDPEAQTARADLEAALRGLKDGSATEQQTVDAMERVVASQVGALQAELAQLRTAVNGAEVSFHDKVKAYFGHLTEVSTLT